MSKRQQKRDGIPWWQSAVVYQIYPRSFALETGAGGGKVSERRVGTLAGVRERLDHLSWLGVDAIWLSPFFRSPMYDFGYDVSDYCDVDPIFGTLDDFDRLVEAAHAVDIKVMIDWVPGHTSIEHPWFVESRASRDADKRDWYVWRDPGQGGALPNNWRAAFLGVPAWTFDEATAQFYLHSFLAEQPDLNWENPVVAEAMLDTLRFWLDRGVDGFRADVIHNIGKDPSLRDVEGKLAPIPHCALNDDPRTHGHLREIRSLLDSYPGDRAVVGEVFLLTTEQVAAYYGQGDELHMSFNFPPLFAAWDAEVWRGHVDETHRVLDTVQAWPTWVLSNHDQKRHRTRYGGGEARARAAAVLLLTLRGTPFLYMGEELGLEDAVIPEERKVDPGNRDGCRAPIPWDGSPGHGWRGEAWLPWPPEASERNAEAMRRDERSILALYRDLLAARRASPALSRGDFAWADAPAGVLAYRRSQGVDERIAAINFEAAPRELALTGSWAIEVDSLGAGPLAFDGVLAPEQAVLLKPGTAAPGDVG